MTLSVVKVAKKNYSSPKLTAYGDVRALTKAGSGTASECGNSGAKKKC